MKPITERIDRHYSAEGAVAASWADVEARLAAATACVSSA